MGGVNDGVTFKLFPSGMVIFKEWSSINVGNQNMIIVNVVLLSWFDIHDLLGLHGGLWDPYSNLKNINININRILYCVKCLFVMDV